MPCHQFCVCFNSFTCDMLILLSRTEAATRTTLFLCKSYYPTDSVAWETYMGSRFLFLSGMDLHVMLLQARPVSRTTSLLLRLNPQEAG
eukprot:6358479-Amphidinium_carterae.1